MSARALVLLDAAPPGEDEHRADRTMARARILMSQGRTDAAISTLEAEIERGDRDALRLELARTLARAGRYTELLERADLDRGCPALRLEIARAHLWTGQVELAAALATELSAPTHDLAVIAGALHVRATCAWQGGDPGQAEALALEGIDLISDRDPALRADLLRSLGGARIYQGKLAAAERVLVEAVRINRSLGRAPELAKSLNNLGVLKYQVGDWEGARPAFQEFRLLCNRVGDPVEIANATNNLAVLTLRLGDRDQAVLLLRRCIREGKRAEYERIVPLAEANLGEALLSLGDLEGAAECFDRAAPVLIALKADADLMELERRRMELMLASGDARGALFAGQLLTRDDRLERAPVEAGQVRRVMALCLLELEDASAAEALSNDALDRLEAQGTDYEVALAREALARVLMERGRYGAALSEIDRATALWRSLGARVDLERISELRELAEEGRHRSGRNARHGEILLDLALGFGSTLDMQRLVPMVLDRVVNLLCAERGLFALFEAGELTTAVVHNLDWAGPGHALPVSGSILSEVLTEGRPVVVQDTREDGEFNTRKSVALLGLRSIVAVPVVARDGVLGVLYIDSRTIVPAELADEVNLLTGIARMVGTAVESARLFEEQRYRTRLLAAMAHDFRTPLTVIIANSEMLEDSNLPAEEVPLIGRDVGACGRRMRRMVENTLALARGDSGMMASDPEPVNLATFLGRHLETFCTLAAAQDIRVALDAPEGLPAVQSVPDRISIILDNLLFNALKFARPGSVITLRACLRDDAGPEPALRRPPSAGGHLFRRVRPVRARPGCRFVEIGVHNHGRPMPADLMDTLFDEFVRGAETQRGVRSTGLGLAIVDQAARVLGGAVWATSSAEDGTRLAFSLPTAVE